MQPGGVALSGAQDVGAVHDPGLPGRGDRCIGRGDLQDTVHVELEGRADHLQPEAVGLTSDRLGLAGERGERRRGAAGVLGQSPGSGGGEDAVLLPAGQVERRVRGVHAPDDSGVVIGDVRPDVEIGLDGVVRARRRLARVVDGVADQPVSPHPVGVGDDRVRSAGQVGPGRARRRGVRRQGRPGGVGEGVRGGEGLGPLTEAPVAEQAGCRVDGTGVVDLGHARAGGDVLVADPVRDDVAVHVAVAGHHRAVGEDRGGAVRTTVAEADPRAAGGADQRSGVSLELAGGDA